MRGGSLEGGLPCNVRKRSGRRMQISPLAAGRAFGGGGGAVGLIQRPVMGTTEASGASVQGGKMSSKSMTLSGMGCGAMGTAGPGDAAG